jgi:acyl-CoA synthetase (AMP-forming)/AMP-acid ligase II
MLPTSEAWLASFFGVLLAGGAAVPVGPNLSFGGMDRFAETVRAILGAADARFLLGDAAIEAHLPALRSNGTPLEHFVRADAPDANAVAHVALPSVSPDDLAVIQYTSGTTGVPKGVMLSHRALLANAHMIGARARMSPRDVGVSWLPLFHDMGLVGALLTALYWRYPLLLMPVESFLLQPRRWVQWLSRKRATLSVAPNFAYQFVLDRVGERHLAEVDLSAWRCAFNGAEAVRPQTLRGFGERFARYGFSSNAFQPVYGMAENCLAATFPAQGQHWHGLTSEGRECVSVGTPLAGVSVAVVDQRGLAVPIGVAGSIRLSSPSLMQGYFRNEAASAEVLNGGWLQTGDVGFIREGELFVTGRSKELIIKRGRNYSPDEVEGVAMDACHGRVLRAAAFGAPDDANGTERLVLVLETHPLSEHEKERLAREISGALVATVGVGQDVTVVVPPKTIERTTSGKLRRVALKHLFLQDSLPVHEPEAPLTAPSEPA